jgi:hypothetical protein
LILSRTTFSHPVKHACFVIKVRENLSSLHLDVQPLAEILVSCGFFLIYFIEEIVHIACGDGGGGGAEEFEEKIAKK